MNTLSHKNSHREAHYALNCLTIQCRGKLSGLCHTTSKLTSFSASKLKIPDDQRFDSQVSLRNSPEDHRFFDPLAPTAFADSNPSTIYRSRTCDGLILPDKLEATIWINLPDRGSRHTKATATPGFAFSIERHSADKIVCADPSFIRISSSQPSD
jgi:hypothetical protein